MKAKKLATASAMVLAVFVLAAPPGFPAGAGAGAGSGDAYDTAPTVRKTAPTVRRRTPKRTIKKAKPRQVRAKQSQNRRPSHRSTKRTETP